MTTAGPYSMLTDACLAVLAASDPAEKADRARDTARLWRTGRLKPAGGETAPRAAPPPGRPDRPELVPPGKVKRRRLNSIAGRTALLHAVAHIEFNAIDLAFDMLARFSALDCFDETSRRAFIDDWIGVGDDEARHFTMVRGRLNELGADYGDLPAHNGLWEAAIATSGDIAARLAVAPLVLEARGLDVTPGMIDRLVSAGDADSADVLRVIYEEEVGHVAAGARWFIFISRLRDETPLNFYQRLVREYFRGPLKPPFNVEARLQAGLPREFYEPLAQTGPSIA